VSEWVLHLVFSFESARRLVLCRAQIRVGQTQATICVRFIIRQWELQGVCETWVQLHKPLPQQGASVQLH
jgi:hypothetical protein